MLRGQLQKLKSWRDSLHESSGPEPPMVELPHSWIWNDFLVAQGWADRKVLDRQEYWYVRQQYAFFELKMQYGLLGG